ncbi:MAG: class II fumarate hydratase [Mitsuaria chitosanitabida]|uniref:class II fumarate hydratase n=1 Tax=Roseateles chitosanitabidus TaxID=65048 RepID=UPI001B27A25C|nr:class II fumarate hydratase [Roseateles chitosanitabidus]MBO9686902.1 class II fumarate hydratase [Roseateles chitosanitabidus]
MTKATRIERDSMGDVAVPIDALYGAQTQRAVDNFAISRHPMPERFVRALLQQKAAAARANVSLEQLPADIGQAIDRAAAQLLQDPQLMTHFPVEVFQTGSGTSSNMNANEVLATLATRLLAGGPNAITVSPNDHVNAGQSSNDSIPTVLHVSAAQTLQGELLPALDLLAQTLQDKIQSVGHHVKTGRTHLMDAMPLRLGQELGGWLAQVDARRAQLRALLPSVCELAQGGTAVGTGINAHPDFARRFCEELSALTGLTFRPAPDFFAALSAQDTAVALSGALKGVAVTLMKISNDLRWMNSGPLAGLAEIELHALQPGSSIMPGKVNPVIPEAVTMVCAQVIGHDAAITIAGQSGNFQLNVMLPLIATNLLDSLALLAAASKALAEQAIRDFKVNVEGLQHALARNPILVTALNREIGYLKAAAIAKRAYAEKRPILDVAEEMTEFDRATLQQMLDPAKLTDGGL